MSELFNESMDRSCKLFVNSVPTWISIILLVGAINYIDGYRSAPIAIFIAAALISVLVVNPTFIFILTKVSNRIKSW
jgi:hypothetical protein